ncbi:MAG TPA: hypothetical protein VHY22_07785 [Chthoniobacteraceae bacterium]|jgi:hypothetical protein|nr:hypothetical protein [Chthoniobacteraceae bacterium]
MLVSNAPPGRIAAMVKLSSLRKWSVLLSGFVFLAGCGNNASAPSGAAPQAAAPTPTPAPKSATPNSFDEVAAHLDPGGDFYLYLSTRQLLAKLDGFINSLHDTAVSQSGGNKGDMDKAFLVLKDVVQKSGVEDVSGFGASSFCYSPGLHRNKIFIHHAPDKGSGLMWSLFGKAPHPLTQLDFLPADTAYAVFGDFDLPQLIDFTRQEALGSGIPEATQAVNQWQTQFAGITGLKLDDVLKSLNGSMGMLVTLDSTSTINVPTGGQALDIPVPRLAIFIAVKNDIIFKQVDKMAGSNPGVIKVDQPDLHMRTMSLPMVPGLNLRPTIAQWNGYLVLASDDQLINQMIAVQKGGPGVKTAPDFVSISANLPAEGNSFAYTSPLFVETVHKIQGQMVANQPNISSTQAQAIQNWFSKYQPMFCGYGVGSILPDGSLTISQGRFTK